MLTIAQLVEDIIKKKSFIEEALSEDLINISSLARYIKEDVEAALGRQVKDGALVMALKRYVSRIDPSMNRKLKAAMNDLGELTVRSQLSDFTYKNSDSMIDQQKLLLKAIGERREVFYTLSRGIYETTIIISNSMDDIMEDVFKNELLVSKISHLSSLTIKLPNENVDVTGLYYSLLRKTTWEKINILEVISTTNEFTIVVDEIDAGRAFNVFKNSRKT